jgi:hypothetical protein
MKNDSNERLDLTIGRELNLHARPTSRDVFVCARVASPSRLPTPRQTTTTCTPPVGPRTPPAPVLRLPPYTKHIVDGTSSLAAGIGHRLVSVTDLYTDDDQDVSVYRSSARSSPSSPRALRPSALDGCPCPAHGYCATAVAARRVRPSSFPLDTRATTRSFDVFPYVPTLPFLRLHPQ